MTTLTPSIPWRVQTKTNHVLLHTTDVDPEEVSRLGRAMETVDGVVAVGAKRLDAEGRVFSMGAFIVHPKGFHHLGRGAEGHAFRFPEEVDAVTGGALVIDAAAWYRVDGERRLADADPALAWCELCLWLRRAGGRILVAPSVTVTDTVDTAPSPDARAGFRARFGFDVLAADLDAVRHQHAGTGLIWHPRVHAEPLAFEKYTERGAMHWTSYAEVDVYRTRADHLIALADECMPAGTILDLGCGDGLFTHLLARRGRAVHGLDCETHAIEAAHTQTQPEIYDVPPRFEVADATTLPIEDAGVSGIIMFDVVEHLPNPVRVLREAERVLAPGGRLVLTTPAWQLGAWSDPVYHVAEYTAEEIVAQVEAATRLRVVTTGRIGGVYRDVVVVAEK